MFEYRTTTCYGAVLPDQLIPPEPGFRLREIIPIVTAESETHNVSDRYNGLMNNNGVSSPLNIPYTQGIQRSKIYQWSILWERYTEQEN